MHVFDNNAHDAETESEAVVVEEEPVVSEEPEVVAEEPVDQDMTVEQAIAEANDEPEEIEEPNEKEAFAEPVPYIPSEPRPVPEYNENAFYPEPEEEATELIELDSFDPEQDSYRNMVTPPEEVPEEVEPIEEEQEEILDDIDEEDADTSFDTDAFEEDDDMDLIAQTAEAHRLADEMEAEVEEEMNSAQLESEADEIEEDEDDFIEEPVVEDDVEEEPAVVEEPKKTGLDAIFAEMDDDAATDPVFDDEEEPLEITPTEIEEEANISAESENVDPLAPPVVNSDGIPFGTSEPIDFEDISLEEMEKENTDTPVVQVEDDFDENDVGVVKLEKPAPLVEEPPAPPKKKIRGPYKVPSDLLDTYSNGEYWLIDEETKQAAADLKETLSEFKIEAEVTGIRKGPVVTMFEILPAPGVKLSKIVALQDNIALRLAASSVRIVAPIPGKHAVGIEVPNKERAVVSFKEIVDLDLPQFSKMAIPVILGKDISGEPQVLDLA
ncbi:MAG: hypothetical protein IJS09_10175, partial [Treponema sp.]|nr:hypothetical protein [Treponema sp.]